MNVNGFELIGDWKVANIGKTAFATRGGKKYFLKSYGEYKLPRREDVTEKTFREMTANFEAFKNNRIAINTTLASFAGSGGNIMLPQHWFVHDINYIEATEFVENVISTEDVVKLPREDLLFIMKTAAGAMFNIHRKNIVHSDLKISNIMVATNSMGKPVAKIIDFDRSYFVNDIRPNDIGGDQAFMSPELTLCFVTDMAEDSVALLSPKSDVFSLGVVFHLLLTGGEFPVIESLTDESGETREFNFCGEGALHGAKLILSEKIEKPYLAYLIANMLQLQPEDRPDSFQVLNTLKDGKVLPLKPESNVVVPEKLRVGSRTPAPAPTPTPTPAPARTTETPAPSAIPEGYCDPWPEHAVEFDIDKIKTFGYVSAQRFESGSLKCYKFYNNKGDCRVFNLNTLKLMGMTKGSDGTPAPTPAPTPTPTPTPAPAPTPAPTPTPERTENANESADSGEEMWPCDRAYTFDRDAITAAGFVGCEKIKIGSVQCYSLIFPSGTRRNVNITALRIMKLVKLKK